MTYSQMDDMFTGTASALQFDNRYGDVVSQSAHHDIHRIQVDDVFGHIRVVPSPCKTVYVALEGGSKELLNGIRFTLDHGTLKIKGKLPIRREPGYVNFGFTLDARGNQHVSNDFQDRGIRPGDIVVDGKALDTARGAVRIKIVVPESVHITLTRVIGAVGFAADHSRLTVNSSHWLELAGKRFSEVVANLAGHVKMDVVGVGNVELRSPAGSVVSGEIDAGEVSDEISVNVTGSVLCKARGDSRDLMVKTDGSVRFMHSGTARSARITALGMSSVKLADIQRFNPKSDCAKDPMAMVIVGGEELP